MGELAWFATTPEGEQLGKLAAQLVQVEWHRVPIWFAPIEPFRWLITLTSAGYPHAKWLAVTYSLLSLLAGFVAFCLIRARRWQRLAIVTVVSLNVMLTLSGGFIAVNWFESVMPFGMRWVVPEDAPFVLANLHTHTTQSNGFLTPEQAVLWHLKRGYKVVAITDSNTVKGGEIAKKFVESANLHSALRIPHSFPLTVLVGEEFRGKTHLLMLNIRRDISPRDFDVPSAIKEVKRQGGIVIAAHPWSGRHSIYELLEWGVDGFEIVNNAVLGDEKLRSLCRKHGLAVLGSLDFRSGCVPETATVLPVWANTPEKVAEALRKGICAVIYFPNQVSEGKFDPLRSWLDKLEGLWQTGGTANLIGVAFWALVASWLWRRRREHEGAPKTACRELSVERSVGGARKFVSTCAVIVALFAVSASLGVWAMARDLKQGWFPPIPLVVSVWAIACFANWLLLWRLIVAEKG